jgi:hypothetical protein
VTLESSEGICLTDQATSVNETASSFSEVWADPQPGHDEGLALIGSRIRCCFEKNVLSETFDKRATTRFLEGEIISVIDYDSQFRQHRSCKRRREAYGTKVAMLVDHDRLESLPFLKRLDSDVDPTQLSLSLKREYINEQTIRGVNKALVQVVLGESSGMTLRKNSSSLEARWVIRKRVPTKRSISRPAQEAKQSRPAQANPNGTSEEGSSHRDTCSIQPGRQLSTDVSNNKTAHHSIPGQKNSNGEPAKKTRRNAGGVKDFASPRYLGDGNDSKTQQETNWRWQASRYDPMPFLKEMPADGTLIKRLSYNFVGEVIRIQPASSAADTLAIVTIKRLVLPEHTESGRMSYHGANEVFEELDSNRSSIVGFKSHGEFEGVCYYQVPVEELVIVSRRLTRLSESSSTTFPPLEYATERLHQVALYVSRSYSFQFNKFVELSDTKSIAENTAQQSPQLCFRCRRLSSGSDKPVSCNAPHWKCNPCTNMLEAVNEHKSDCQSEGISLCDCDECSKRIEADRLDHFFNAARTAKKRMEPVEARSSDDEAGFVTTRTMIKRMKRADFGVLHDMLSPSMPSLKPIVRVKPRSPKKSKKSLTAHASILSTNANRVGTVKEPTASYASRESGQDPTENRPTCSRLLPYDVTRRKFEVSESPSNPWIGTFSQGRDKPRNLRLASNYQSGTGDNEKEEKSDSRAARVNQRRLLRDVAAVGVSFDMLAGREQQLRFDRSSIHAWGVFADDDIKEGELLVEYRGEIIGNSMAEKREKEYEHAKIGSDYMFRIDGLSVCDATKQGNVARFINATCNPNCVTKIISIDNSKRIVVYAKRDIRAGEELCYDYKFPLEYDEEKRIQCHCGARDCRGFMNWVSH